MDRRQVLGRLAAASAVPFAGMSWGATYPERPIRIVQGYAAGGNADTIARIVSAEMAKSMGQVINVDAVTGAGGTIAAGTVARAPADGYTMLIGLGGHAIAPALYSNLRYRTVEDFEMVSMITTFPMLIVARSDAPFKNFADVLTAARVKPNAVAWGSAGIGTGHHLGGELLAKMANIQWLHIPFRGDATSVTALLAGDVPIIFAPPTAVTEHIKAGKVKALAVTSIKRWSGMPDVVPVAEQGVPGYEVKSWAGFMVPAGTPRPIVERLSAEVNKALQVPSVRKRLEEMGGEVQGSTPEQMKAFVAAEVAKWGKVAREANIAQQS